MKLGGEAGECFGWRGEAMAGAGSSGFELRGRKDAHGAGMATGQMLLDFLPFDGWKLTVDEGVEPVRVEMFGGLIGLRRLSHSDSPSCGCRS